MQLKNKNKKNLISSQLVAQIDSPIIKINQNLVIKSFNYN